MYANFSYYLLTNTEQYFIFFLLNSSEYAQVIKMLGNGRLEAMCFDGVKRLCHIRGKLRKKVSMEIYFIFIQNLLF